MIARGSSARLAYVEEVSFGVPPPNPQMRLIHFSAEELLAEELPLEEGRLEGLRYIDAGGKIDLELDLDSLGTLLKHTLGLSTTTGAAAPFTHVIKGSSSLPPGLSIEKGFPDIGQFLLFKGCRISGLSLSFPELKGSLTLLARGVQTSSTPFASSLAPEPPGAGKSDRATAHYTTLEEGGLPVSGGSALGGQVVIENLLHKDGFVLGQRERYSLQEGPRRVHGSLVLAFEGLGHYSRFFNATPSSIRIRMSAPGGSGASMEVYLPRIFFRGMAPIPVVKSDGLGVRIPFTAQEDPVEGTDIKITLVNNVSAV